MTLHVRGREERMLLLANLQCKSKYGTGKNIEKPYQIQRIHNLLKPSFIVASLQEPKCRIPSHDTQKPGATNPRVNSESNNKETFRGSGKFGQGQRVRDFCITSAKGV